MAASKSKGTNGDGRGANGRFVKGWKGGPGNPRLKAIESLRIAVRDSVTVEDLRAVMRMLVTKAKEGDMIAIRELLDRAVGRPQQSIDIEGVGPFTLYADVDNSRI